MTDLTYNTVTMPWSITSLPPAVTGRGLPGSVASSISPAGYCGVCGYDLRAIGSNRCPECGTPFDPAEPIAPIPWLHRVHLGRWTAFWRTVRIVLTNPQRLARQVHPTVQVDAHAAARFRAICARIAAGGVAISITLLCFRHFYTATILYAVASVPWTLFFCYFASIPTDTTGLRWEDSCARFRWLHEFTSAPLALSPPLLIGATLLGVMSADDLGEQAVYPAAAIVLILAAWLSYMFGFQIRAAHRRPNWVAGQLLVYFWWWGLLGLFCATMTFTTVKVIVDFL